MKKIILIIVLVSVFTLPSTIIAQDNPFISKKPSKMLERKISYPSFLQKILKKISVLQYNLNQRLASLSKEIKEKKSKKPIFIIILVTFIYGMIHALGPGHGKTIIFSYFLRERPNIREGIIAGNLIGFLHAGSALILVLILYFIIKKSFLHTIEDVSRLIKLISYGLITLIGLYLLIKTSIDFKKQRDSNVINIHAIQNTKSLIPFSIAVGMVPCTGTTIILLFSLSIGIPIIGIISTFFMALGMATTISLVGILTITAKQNAIKFVSRKNRLSSIFERSTSVIGSLLMISLGILLFTSNI